MSHAVKFVSKIISGDELIGIVLENETAQLLIMSVVLIVIDTLLLGVEDNVVDIESPVKVLF